MAGVAAHSGADQPMVAYQEVDSGEIVVVKFDEGSLGIPKVLTCTGRVTNWSVYYCQLCPKRGENFVSKPRFYGIDDYAAHCAELHVTIVKLPFICPHCSAGFANKSDMEIHMFRRPKSGFLCKLCSHVTSGMEGMRDHFSQIHTQIVYRKYVDPSNLDNAKPSSVHCERAHAVKKITSYKRQVTSFMRKATSQCNYCGKILSNCDTMKDHVLRIHTKGFVCKVCGKSFKYATPLRSHIENAHSTTAQQSPNLPLETHALDLPDFSRSAAVHLPAVAMKKESVDMKLLPEISVAKAELGSDGIVVTMEADTKYEEMDEAEKMSGISEIMNVQSSLTTTIKEEEICSD